MSEDFSKKLLTSKLPSGFLPPRTPFNMIKKNRKDFTPLPWQNYFERQRDLKVDEDIFRLYESGSTGPVCCFLHGGGFSGLSWALLAKNLAKLIICRCLAIDMRGHGDTLTIDDQNLSAEVLARDVGRVIERLFGEDLPHIVLIGHSVGGAIAVQVAYEKIIPFLSGLIVIDVVEGTALEALSSMQSFLRSRPSSFKSVEAAIEYCCKSGQIRNIESAKVSVLGQLKRADTNETATSEASHNHQFQDKLCRTIPENGGALKVEEDEYGLVVNDRKHPDKVDPANDADDPGSSNRKISQMNDSHVYKWRIDLTTTEQYWKGWFEGLSHRFLNSSQPKMLLLAGIDRMDKELTIGQMQGKFQLELMPQCGHSVHEDCPDKVAERFANFLVRNRIALPLIETANR